MEKGRQKSTDDVEYGPVKNRLPATDKIPAGTVASFVVRFARIKYHWKGLSLI